MLIAPLSSVPHIDPNGFAKPFAYEVTALWSRWPVPLTSLMFSWTLPIIASPYVVPEVTVYGVGRGKSTHEKVVPMFTDFDCSSRAPAVFPLTAYIAAIAFPADVPSI